MSIKEEVAARRMPPWHIDKTVGIHDFENDRSLSEQQIATLVRWVDEGAPNGDPSDMPPPLEWPDEQVWTFAEKFGEPDLILTSPTYKVPAQAQDAWYKPVVETGLTEPRWVRAIEIRPNTIEGRKVIHHALARLGQEEPEHRQLLALSHAIQGGPRALDIPPNTVSVHQGFHVMKKAGRVENFQPHMHLRGKAMSMEAILPDGKAELLRFVDHFEF